MEIFLALIAIVLAWRLWPKANKGDAPRQAAHEQSASSESRPDPTLKAWQDARDFHESNKPMRRESALTLARAGRLSRKQIEIFLETSSQFEFSSAEMAELEALRRAQVPLVGAAGRCKICGLPALPDDDLCYSHHAK